MSRMDQRNYSSLKDWSELCMQDNAEEGQSFDACVIKCLYQEGIFYSNDIY